jgi:phospholipid/cholesterol/gamma-HCH transport system substrate-binding protein
VNTRAPSAGRLVVIVGFALSCFGLLLYLWMAFGGAVPLGPKGYRIGVEFDEATQLTEQADVRISGVPVGKVVKVGESPDGGIRAEIELRERYAPLPRDARATLRQKTLLGETFVELTPGTRGGPAVREGGTLPPGNVRPTVELDEVLRALDEPTRRDLKALLHGVAEGFERGGGERLSAALGELPGTTESAGDLLAILDAERGAVRSLVRDSGRAFGAVGRRRAETRALVRSGDALLATTAARRDDLERTLHILPTFLSELRLTLASAERAAGDAAPVVRSLRRAAPLAAPALRDVVALLPQLRGLLRDLDPALAAARPALPGLTRTIDDARPLVRALHVAARDLVPVADYLGAYKSEVITPFMNVAAATQDTFRAPGAEAALHYLRVLIPVTNEGPVNQPRRLPSNRHNAYMRPRALDRLAEGLESFDCGHLGNPQTVPVAGSAPKGCTAMEPWSLGGRPPRAFQHLERSPP